MTDVLRVEDMRSYLATTGWARRPETWRGATLWDHPGGYGALVPPRDGMDDAEERTWELLQVLSRAEGRPAPEIARDVASPWTDAQAVHTHPFGQPAGFVGLADGLRALAGIRNLFASATRCEAEGRRFAYRGTSTADVAAVLATVRLGPTQPGSYVYPVRVDAGNAGAGHGNGVTPRRTTARLHRAVTAATAAAAAAAASGDYGAFDDAVPEGLSANLCEALSDLGGEDRRQPFEIAFRWARGLPDSPPADTVGFGAGAGLVLRTAARRLWRLDASGDAAITGTVESLHDDPEGSDRWRVRVRGMLTSAAHTEGERRTLWLRISESDYQVAVDAHLRRATVEATGSLVATGRRTEMAVAPDDFRRL